MNTLGTGLMSAVLRAALVDQRLFLRGVRILLLQDAKVSLVDNGSIMSVSMVVLTV